MENKKRGRPPKNGVMVCEVLDNREINLSFKKVAEALLRYGDEISVKEIAENAQISKDMVYRYLKDEEFNEYLDALIEREIKLSGASIFKKLKEMCQSGDLQAMKLYFEICGRKEKSAGEGANTVINIIDDVPNVTKDELKSIYGTLAGEVEN